MTPTPGFKVTTFFDAEYLISATLKFIDYNVAMTFILLLLLISEMVRDTGIV